MKYIAIAIIYCGLMASVVILAIHGQPWWAALFIVILLLAKPLKDN